MLQIRSTVRFEDIELVLKAAAQKHNSDILVVSHLGQTSQEGNTGGPRDAFVFTLCHSKLYTALLAADIRFAGFLPARVAVVARLRWGHAGSHVAFRILPGLRPDRSRADCRAAREGDPRHPGGGFATADGRCPRTAWIPSFDVGRHRRSGQHACRLAAKSRLPWNES